MATKRRKRTAERQLHIFSGSVYPELAQEIAEYLDVELGDIKLEKFANGECYARYMESIRGEDVFLIQSVSGEVNDALMELLIMVDAAKRASAARIHAVITHYGYARQDRKSAAREPITAKLVADLLQTAGVHTVTTIDLHQGQIQGFFNIPVNHMTALYTFCDYFKKKNLDNVCVVSPDVGRAKAAKKMSDILGADLAIMHKGRPKHNVAEITSIIGDVEGKECILFDDMVDTAGSLCNAAKAIVEVGGAKKVYACASHGVLSGPALERLAASSIEELALLDTIPAPAGEEELAKSRIKYLTVAPMFAEAIERTYQEISIAKLFN